MSFYAAPRQVAVPLFLTLLLAPTLVGPLASAPRIGDVDTLERAYSRWSLELAATGRAHRLAIPVGFSKGLSAEFSRAGGIISIDLASGRVEADFVGIPQGDFELWVVDNRTQPGSSVRVDPSDTAVRIDRVARKDSNTASASTASLSRSLPSLPPHFEIDRVIVARAGSDPLGSRSVLIGSPSLFQRIYYAESSERLAHLVPKPAIWNEDRRQALTALVEAGASLFVNETFDGNGRTCASCHPPQNNFTIDPEFIATLAPSDPLFVHENNAALTQLENAVLLRDFALILANVDGLEDPTQKFVMRGVPHTLGLSHSIFNGSPDIPLQNTGWSGDGAPHGGTLRDFAIGAVRQHATKTLDRIEGVDFRLPTEAELDQMEAFQLALGRPTELETLTMTLVDADAEEGRVLFNTIDSEGGTKQASKCILCHGQAGALSLPSGRNQNFDIGVEDQPHPADAVGEPRPRDGGFGTVLDPDTGGFGDGRFATPSIIEAADTPPYFHNNVSPDLDNAIFFYQSDAFQQSPAGVELLARDSAGVPLAIETFKLGSYLRVLNTLENVRSSIAYARRAQRETSLSGAAEILDIARRDIDDGIEVLAFNEQHPDVSFLLQKARGAVETAMTLSDPVARNAELDSALFELKSSQPLMVVPRIRIFPLENLDTVSGTVEIASQVLDVEMRSVEVQIELSTLCVDTEAPYSCTWDTTTVANGTYTVTATGLDFQSGLTVSKIDLEVAN